MTIRVLDEALINQIAAGEVVERPASVVKELVENALDAGATTIDVLLRDGGRTLIRVADDGIGMGRADALMCLERHATSKIRNQHDLVRVGTLGFRGEAVPSIASVSRFTILTRDEASEVGTRVQVDGGTLVDASPAACAQGTQIDVRNLFFNVPVRRKFLRTVPTELGHAVEAVARQAMLRPDVSFTVRHGERELLRAPQAADHRRRVRDVLGPTGHLLIDVGFERDGVRVEGLASPATVHRPSGKQAMYLYVNGRFVRDPIVRRGVNEAYRGLVPKGRYPVVVLSVHLDPQRVDVNVHPAKTEVRFRDPRDLVRVLAEGLRGALRASGIQRTVFREPVGPAPAQTGLLANAGLPAHPTDDPLIAQRAQTQRAEPAPGAEAASSSPWRPDADWGTEAKGLLAADDLAPQRHSGPEGALRLIGGLGEHYLVCADGHSLVLIDAHAAREALVERELAAQVQAGLVPTYTLDTPLVVQVSRSRSERVGDFLPLLEDLGLRAELFGPGAIAVLAVPSLLRDAPVQELLHDVVAALAPGADDPLAGLIAVLAAHAPQVSSNPQALIESLDAAALARPGVRLRIPRDEIERRLSRP